MNKSDLMVLGLAGVAVLLILKSGGLLPGAFARTVGARPNTGLSYDPPPGYGDTSRYTDYAETALRNGSWGIE